MALTTELLTAVEGLTDDQKAKIVELSANDEDQVIARKVGEVHGLYDSAFSEIYGDKKPNGVKSTVFWKEQFSNFKTAAEKGGAELKQQLEQVQAENTKLQEQLKSGNGNEALKKQIADNETLISQLKGSLESQKKEWEAKYNEALQETSSLYIDNEFERALVGLKFKNEKIIPLEVRNSFIDNAKKGILAKYSTERVDNGQGGKTLVFRNEAGEIARNSANGLNPYTPGELLSENLKPVLDLGKEGKGAGSNGGGGGGGADSFSIGDAKTQSEAAEIITQGLMGKGLARGTDEYQSEFDKAWSDNKIASLPLQ